MPARQTGFIQIMNAFSWHMRKCEVLEGLLNWQSVTLWLYGVLAEKLYVCIHMYKHTHSYTEEDGQKEQKQAISLKVILEAHLHALPSAKQWVLLGLLTEQNNDLYVCCNDSLWRLNSTQKWSWQGQRTVDYTSCYFSSRKPTQNTSANICSPANSIADVPSHQLGLLVIAVTWGL